ncbi:putative succinate dehydrogenase [ubiquinone] cytochrome b small subunit, mitochondrial [Aphelenchoides bicaudatus]|nr:putative succinate dehydrogenase [ubiquinone] cytochrome b small subunit, mitochondrial [Aphelenchoides bicaudatus]
MQRIFTNSSYLVMRSACLRPNLSSNVFRPSIRQLTTTASLSATPVTPSKQVPDKVQGTVVEGVCVTDCKPIPSYSGYFKLERQVFVATLPLLPISYFVHGSVMDTVLALAIVANCHFGAHAVLTDYARPIVVGEGVAKLAHYGAYLSTILLLAGLLHFNYNDVGLTRAFELVFSL